MKSVKFHSLRTKGIINILRNDFYQRGLKDLIVKGKKYEMPLYSLLEDAFY